MCAQAKTLTRETFRVKPAPFSYRAEPSRVSITLVVGRRDQDTSHCIISTVTGQHTQHSTTQVALNLNSISFGQYFGE